MRRVLMATLMSAVLVGVVLAQAPPPMPKPGPELKRIGYFAGSWKTEGEAKASAFGPAGKLTFTDHNEWLPGGFFMVMHSEGKGPMGEMKGLAVFGYNSSEKVYTYQAYNNMGMSESAKGTVSGDTWTWTSESKMGGKPLKTRFIIKELSPTSFTFKFDTSPDGKIWSTIEEGKATKTK